MNTLIVIGYLGCKECYLNITREEAITRYKEYTGDENVPEHIISEFKFDDQFSCYEAWK